MPGFIFNNSTATFFTSDTGTVAAGSISYTAPSYLTSATILSPSRYGVKNGPAVSITVNKSFDTEQVTGVRANVGSAGNSYGNNVNWATFTTNSPYAEGELTGIETTQPFTIYTRDVNTNYGKKQWFVPTPMNLIRGQVISTSTTVVAIAGTSTYTRSTSTGSINAFTITPTTRITRTPIIVTDDPNGIATVGTVSGSGPWTFNITGLTSLTGFTTGTIISSIGRIGNAGAPGNPANITYVTAVNTNSISCLSYGSITPVTGIINSVYATGESIPSIKIAAITTITGSSWFFNITGLQGTSGIVASAGSGTIITITTTSGSTGTVGSVGGNSLVVTSVDSSEQIKVYAYGGTTPFAGTITSITTGTLGSYPFQGDAEFITPGTYSWTAPLGVTSVSAVAIGGGGAGYNSWANAAGAGAGLGWKNNIAVTPGQSYTVVVGAGGAKNGGTGGNSYFINLTTVAGYGGGNASSGANTSGPNANGYGGGYVGDGGGAGGNATNYAGGGGAGGYSGTGGNAQGLPGASSGGAAGGGYYSSTYGSGAGGGTGIYGRGETASGWWHGSSGQVFTSSAGNGGGGAGGSGGTRGRSGENPANSVGESGNSDGYGGDYGGGGGGPGTNWPNASGSGGKGAVRIIFGSGRAFPATNTSAVISAVTTATIIPTRSSLIGGPMVNWESRVIVTNYMQYPKSVGIDRPAQLVITNNLGNDAAIIKAFYTNSGTAGGGRSITNTLIGSENFFVDGSSTGTNLTSQTAYWI